MQPKQEHHVMRHVKSFTRYDMFICDRCGRQMLLHREPGDVGPGEQPLIMLERGDSGVSHSGGMGGVAINSVAATPDHDAAPCQGEPELSEEWKRWLTDIFDQMDDASPD